MILDLNLPKGRKGVGTNNLGLFLGIIFSLITYLIVLYFINKKLKKKLTDNFLQNQEYEKVIQDFDYLQKSYKDFKDSAEAEMQLLKDLNIKNHLIIEEMSTHEKENQINFEQIKETQLQNINLELKQYQESKLKQMQEEHEDIIKRMISERLELNEMIEPLRNELIEYQQKRQVINENIQRERLHQMQKDFHRILLSVEAEEDIQYLLSIEKNIHNKEVLRKLIYETYIKTPLNEMTKRVLNNEDPCGIYKITDKDGLSYIGKSTKVKSRWINHIKTALGIGTISNQEIHTAIKIQGFDKFNFELLEECPKEKLTEREKYFIDFFETYKMGYNMKVG